MRCVPGLRLVLVLVAACSNRSPGTATGGAPTGTAASGSGPTASGSGPTASGSGPTASGSGPTASGSATATDDAGPPRAAGAVLERVAIAPAADGRDGVHGMVIFGERDVYVSHLPMFHRPHDVQLVARVRVTAVEGAMPSTFAALHTIAPERFRLDDVLTGKRTRFRAALHRGNFEDGGVKIATVDLDVDDIIVARPLGDDRGDGERAARNDAGAEYYLLGSLAGEQWAVHRITGAPSFDAIARVAFATTTPAPGRYRGGRTLVANDVLTSDASAFTLTEVRMLSCLVGPDFTSRCP